MAWGGGTGAAAVGMVLAGLACGRLGYDPSAAPRDASGADAAPPRPLCESLPPLDGEPVIDGAIDGALVPVAIEVGGWKGPPPGPPPGNQASAAVAWWPGGLYVYLDVTDPERLPPPASDPSWCGDGVELYADSDASLARPPDYDRVGTRQLVLVAPADDTTSVTRGEIFRQTALVSDWPGDFAAYPRPGGYLCEAMIRAADLGIDEWTLEQGRRVGFDLAVNVSSSDGTTSEGNCPDGTRLGQYFLRIDPDDTSSCAGHPYCNAAAFCTPELAD